MDLDDLGVHYGTTLFPHGSNIGLTDFTSKKMENPWETLGCHHQWLWVLPGISDVVQLSPRFFKK